MPVAGRKGDLACVKQRPEIVLPVPSQVNPDPAVRAHRHSSDDARGVGVVEHHRFRRVTLEDLPVPRVVAKGSATANEPHFLLAEAGGSEAVRQSAIAAALEIGQDVASATVENVVLESGSLV